MIIFENVSCLASATSSLYKNAKVHHVYHRCLCFILDTFDTTAQDYKSLHIISAEILPKIVSEHVVISTLTRVFYLQIRNIH